MPTGPDSFGAEYPRLYDTSQPIDAEHGTPGLSGDYGNVLIIQDDEFSEGSQGKANEVGGKISILFEEPVTEPFEVGLLNIVSEVVVETFDEHGESQEYIVSPGGENSFDTMRINLVGIESINVHCLDQLLLHISACVRRVRSSTA